MGTDEINSTKIQVVKKAQGIYNPLSKRLYTLNEAAKYLGRTLWSMRELVWAGKIPIVRDGKRIFIDFNDLDSYISKNKMTYI
jgi:excisionase family DNA binding protein